MNQHKVDGEETHGEPTPSYSTTFVLLFRLVALAGERQPPMRLAGHSFVEPCPEQEQTRDVEEQGVPVLLLNLSSNFDLHHGKHQSEPACKAAVGTRCASRPASVYAVETLPGGGWKRLGLALLHALVLRWSVSVK